VTRTPDPDDRRAKLVVPTARGREVIAVAQGLVPELEARVTGHLSADRLRALREDLEIIRRARHRRAAPRSRLITDLWPNGPGVTRHCRIGR
jgi:hypothetical protein